MYIPPFYAFDPNEEVQIERDVERELGENPGYMPTNFVMYASTLMSVMWKRMKSARADAMLRQPVYAAALDETRQTAQSTAERRAVALNGDCLPEQG